MYSKEILSKNLKKYMSINDIQGVELAEMLGIKPASVSAWVTGKCFPRINYIEQMANIFHCQKSDLIEDTENITKGYELTTEEYLIIQSYRNANAIEKEMVKKAINYYERLNELERSIYEHNQTE